MKKIILLVFMAGLFLPAMSKTDKENINGDSVDKCRYRIAYTIKFVKDTTQTPFKYVSDGMRLDIGDHCSKFYSENNRLRDSIMAVKVQRMDFDFTGVKSGLVHWTLFKDSPSAGKFAVLELLSEKYKVIEDVDLPEWKVVADSSKTVLGYKCQLATINYKGRTWYAWYAEDIPMNNGPWKLCGLPGLILCAYDSGKQFSFEATGMQKMHGEAIVSMEKSYKEINRKSFDKIKRRLKVDPVGALNLQYGNRIKVYNADGSPLKSEQRPFNPIER
jgi:GLPGLI family protein